MGGNGLFNILIQTAKSKMAGFVAKFKLYTSWNFIKTRIVIKIRDFFANLLGFKPRDKDDYFTIGRWMLSKRLIYASVIIIGVVSIWYISSETSLFKRFDETGIRTYKYNSVRLRTAKGHVRITGKSGYLAYDGEVDGGYATGEGTLLNPQGITVYAGTFAGNKYEGNGKLNYESGNLHYSGTFHDNLYEGEGTLYRENGTVEYVGDFSGGLKNGEGVLYDSGENEIYSGAFSCDNIVYSELLGKSAEEVSERYKGSRRLYMSENESVVVMDDINALYHGIGDEGALIDEETVDSVYIFSNNFTFGNDTEIGTITELKEYFGDPVYEGNSDVILPEAIAINILNENKRVFDGPIDMETDNTFSDVAQVIGYDRDSIVYIYSFQRGDIIYSFVCTEKGDTFEFYYITGAEEQEDAA